MNVRTERRCYGGERRIELCERVDAELLAVPDEAGWRVSEVDPVSVALRT